MNPADVRIADTERALTSLSAPTTRGMPMLGIGTHHHATYDECLENVRQALQIGYRHIDTTVRREAYYNESAVGDAVAKSEVTREDIFVATKVDPADLNPRNIRISVEASLDRLGMEYVDMLYPRWPTDRYEAGETLDAFGTLYEEGLIGRIGVSNFTVELLKEALDVSEKPIFANQVEMHPLLPQEELRAFCARDDVDVELVAYSPLARSNVEDVDELQDVATKHEASPEQISLAWLREKGVSAIPRATTTEHLRENWLSLGVELDDKDMATLDSIEEHRRIVNPDDAPWNR
ncbi:aldo/keto reductase [Halosimplex aquaticum]|uniref:Aldo/keto reductase n=1 Tax=Halosimplex aquaticum TaxID=3026162 RepID=A0ABD5XYC3_9EURY